MVAEETSTPHLPAHGPNQTSDEAFIRAIREQDAMLPGGRDHPSTCRIA
jgi:hypothetical protein